MKSYRTAAISGAKAGGKIFHLEANVPTIPNKADALFWLDGIISGNTFVDKSGNNRHFTITNKDFEATWLAGMPYKSTATISAPVGDAVLIAADIDNFLYASNGTPNQIPVVSLFQDIGYKNKLFCRHFAQVVNGDGAEINEPRVLDIVLYNTVKVGGELTNCQTYYGVPVEDVSTMAWLSPLGNDTTGDGSKANPYRTLTKIKSTTKTNIYAVSGDYTLTASILFDGASAVNIISTGLCTFSTYAGALGLQSTKPLTFRHWKITGTASTYLLYTTGVNATFDKSYLIGPKIRALGATDVITLSNCIKTGTGNAEIFNTCATPNLNLDTCFITLITGNSIDTTINKVNNSRISGLLRVNANQYIGNKITGYVQVYAAITNMVFNWNKITTTTSVTSLSIVAANDANKTGIVIKNNDITSSNQTSGYVVYIASGAGESGYNAINGLTFRENKITNTKTGAGTTHTLFIGGGINNIIRYNVITATHGYGMVLKAGGRHYTTTDSHIAYNIFKILGSVTCAILNRGAWGVICANNTIVGMIGTGAIAVDDDGQALDNSMLAINNVISLAGTTGTGMSGTNMTSRNNTVNKNGQTLTTDIGVNDFLDSTVVDSSGIPASKIEHAETITGDNDTGLASTYVIPTATNYQDQGATWQNGAVLLL